MKFHYNRADHPPPGHDRAVATARIWARVGVRMVTVTFPHVTLAVPNGRFL
jgi:hypothetical protein